MPRTLALCSGLVAAVLLLSGCQQTIPKEALQLSQVSVEKRQRQTRYFETTSEADILAASAAVLQDLGFNLDESETDLGLIVGSKERDATETGQVVGSMIMAVLFGAATPVDDKQKIRASLVSKPDTETGRISVRITFQRIIWNTQGKLSRVEGIDDPGIYQDFFDKLSKSVFLEAEEI